MLRNDTEYKYCKEYNSFFLLDLKLGPPLGGLNDKNFSEKIKHSAKRNKTKYETERLWNVM